MIYAPKKEFVMSLKKKLSHYGLKALSYHAGMQAKTGLKIKISFFTLIIQSMIATIAFAMGLDKQNIRSVLHCFPTP